MVDVLGQPMPPGHFCLLRNVCANASTGTLTLFDPTVAGPTWFEFPRRRRYQDHATVVTNDPSLHQLAKSQGRHHPQGTVLFLRPSTCCGSVLDNLEPMPSVFEMFEQLRSNASLRREMDFRPSSGGNLDVHVLFAANTHPHSPQNGTLPAWSRWMLNVAVSGAGGGEASGGGDDVTPTPPPTKGPLWKTRRGRKPPRTTARGGGGPSKPIHSVVRTLMELSMVGDTSFCFDRLLVPGAPEAFFASRKAAYRFRDLVTTVARQDKHAATAQNKNFAWMLNVDRPDGTIVKNERVVVFAVRHAPRRGLQDNDELLRLLEREAGRRHAVAKAIDCNTHSVLSQIAHAQQADAFVSVRGSDFANMIFMRPKTAVVELNNIFSYGSAARLLSHKLGLQYFSWTCTHRRCAFGGDVAQWDAFTAANELTVDEASGEISVPDLSPFVWPATGYAGHSQCPNCVALRRRAPMQAPWIENSPIEIKYDRPVVADLLRTEVFPSLGWVDIGLTDGYRAPK